LASSSCPPAWPGASEAELILPDLAVAVVSSASTAGRSSSSWARHLRLRARLQLHAVQLAEEPAGAPLDAEISELIYETCKTYLITQGKFILLLEVFIGAIMVVYFGFLMHFDAIKVVVILLASLVGIGGSYGVAWFGIRVNTFANSRTAFASLGGKPFPTYAIPAPGRHEHRHAADQRRARADAGHPALHPARLRRLVLHRLRDRRVARRLGAPHRRRHLHQDRRHRLRPHEDRLQHQGGRCPNPGVIADCTGDNAGDSVGPSADGFETYGVTGVALISFICSPCRRPRRVQVQLLVWIFVMRLMMLIASAARTGSTTRSRAAATPRRQDELRGAPHQAGVDHVDRVGRHDLWRLVSADPRPRDGTLWWKLSTIITCGTLAGAIIPEVVKVFTSTESGHVREVVTASREGGASLNVISGLVAGNFSAYWMGW
jgi:K(+)-stimulated pyrophosphate-energized sodium pump